MTATHSKSDSGQGGDRRHANSNYFVKVAFICVPTQWICGMSKKS